MSIVAAAAVYQDRVSLSVQPGRSWNSLCIGILFCLICFALLFLFPPIWLLSIVSLAVLKGNAPIPQAGPDLSVSQSHGIYISTIALMAVRDLGTFFSLRLIHYSKPRKATRCSPSMLARIFQSSSRTKQGSGEEGKEKVGSKNEKEVGGFRMESVPPPCQTWANRRKASQARVLSIPKGCHPPKGWPVLSNAKPPSESQWPLP